MPIPLAGRRLQPRSVLFLLLNLVTASCGGDEDLDTPEGDAGPGDDAGIDPDDIRCGNGMRDGADECEGNDGCEAGELCTATCTCEAPPPVPTTSQTLIAGALLRGDIAYPTSLLYRAWALFGDSRLPPEYDGEAWQWEDAALFREAARVWGSLDADTQAGLQPFLLRPTEPGSYHSPVENRGGPAGAAPVLDCPYQPNAGTRDWRSTASAGNHFLIWSCGGGDPAQDPYAAERTVAATIAEAVYAEMTPEIGIPEPDEYPIVDGTPDERIDVYLVEPNRCKARDGACVVIPVRPGETTLAAAVGTRPCKVGRTGALAASSFFMLDVDHVPAAGETPGMFRHVFAHEYFHLMQNALNLQAQGGGCSGDGRVDDTVTSWLVEASAEWAAAAYFPADWPEQRTGLFTRFQSRDPSELSLRANGVALQDYEYQAFLYPRFVEQETGERTAFIDMWKTSGGARTAAQLDDLLNDVLPFAEHFRDFAVQNFNIDLPGGPIPILYHTDDAALPGGVPPRVLQPTVSVDFPTEYTRPVKLQPLTAQYEHFVVDEHIQSVRVDLQELQNSGFVQLDVLAKVGGTWKRRREQGLVFQFCREDPGDDIEEFYLVVSHHDRKEGLVASGDYQLRARFDCPTEWQGTIRYVHTLQDSYTRIGPAGTDAYDRTEREVQTWTVVGTREAGTAPQTYTELSMHWSASYEEQAILQSTPTACLGGMSYSFEFVTGTANGTDVLGVFPLGAGSYSASPTQPSGGQIDCIGSQSVEYCTGETAELALADTRYNYLPALYGSVQGLAMLVPDEDDGQRYAGSATVLHSELPQDGGSTLIDQTVTWELTRR